MPKGYYPATERAEKTGDYVRLHVLISPEEHKKLVALTRKKKISASAVVRGLISGARA